MGYFHYKLIGKDGVVRGGLVNLPFESPLSAIAFLEQKGASVIFAQPLPPVVGAVYGVLERLFEEKVTVGAMAEALNNMAVMLKSGISVVSAIQDAIADSDNPTMSKVGHDLVGRIQAGSSLSEAVRAWGRFFPDTVQFLMRIGEETGALDRTIHDASKHMIKVDKIYRETKSALTYPAFMFTAIFAAAAFWLYFVVPMILPLLTSTGKQLPGLTLGIIATADFLRDYLGWIMMAIMLIIIGFRTMMRKVFAFRRRVHKILLHVPVIGKLIHASNLAFITEYLSLLLNAGVDVIKSIDILSVSLSNEVYKEKMAEVRANLINGLGLKNSFAMTRLFPPFVVRLIGIGETSGALSTQLDFASVEYARRLEDLIKGLSKSIEPIALAFGGGVFVTLLIGMFMPLYGLAK
ncbi:MAG: type II secretion system F family protein [Magnetococcales bacterium]|nr:type II secretion system F family protein [Magnetococcales bacterium]